MQVIDEVKLSEFASELSGLSVEPTEKVTEGLYDRNALIDLEDHVVDLCQLSIDCSHGGLKWLCERMKNNIREHLVSANFSHSLPTHVYIKIIYS